MASVSEVVDGASASVLQSDLKLVRYYYANWSTDAVDTQFAATVDAERTRDSS